MGLVLSTADAKLSYTAFCPPNHVRVFSAARDHVPVSCERCPDGWRSLGGLALACEPCDTAQGAVQCQQTATGFHDVTFQADPRLELLSGDEVVVQLRSYSTATSPVPSYTVNSEVVRLDFTPPANGRVRDAKPCHESSEDCLGPRDSYLNGTVQSQDGRDLKFWHPSGSQPRAAAWWDGFVDAESGIALYEACVGTAPLRCDVVGATQIASAENENVTSLGSKWSHQFLLPTPPAHNQTRCFAVRATNRVGLSSDWVSSRWLLGF